MNCRVIPSSLVSSESTRVTGNRNLNALQGAALVMELKQKLRVGLVLLLALLNACGDENNALNSNADQIGQNISETTLLPEGIYEVVSWRNNEATCDAAGTLDADAPKYMVSFGFERVGWWTLRLVSCNSLEECESLQSELDVDADAGGDVVFDLGTVAADGFSDETYVVQNSPSESGDCDNGKKLEKTLAVNKNEMVLQVFETLIPSYPATEQASCFADVVQDAAEGAPCSSRSDVFLRWIQ